MQIFMLDQDPEKSAEKLFLMDPPRGQKQIVEIAQIVAHTAYTKDLPPFRKINGEEYRILKSISNHPVTRWVSESDGNLFKLLTYSISLNRMFESRRGVFHKSHLSLIRWIGQNKGIHFLLTTWADKSKSDGDTYKFFGSYDVPGETVFDKYHYYLRVKQIADAVYPHVTKELRQPPGKVVIAKHISRRAKYGSRPGEVDFPNSEVAELIKKFEPA